MLASTSTVALNSSRLEPGKERVSMLMPSRSKRGCQSVSARAEVATRKKISVPKLIPAPKNNPERFFVYILDPEW